MGQGDVPTRGSKTVLAHIFTGSYRISDSNKGVNSYYPMSNTALPSKEDQCIFINFNSSFPHDNFFFSNKCRILLFIKDHVNKLPAKCVNSTD